MTQNPTVKLLIDDNGVALVTLSRLQVANALNSDMALEIKEIFYNLPPQVRAVILTGEGDRAFCAGADLKERHGMDMEAWQIQHQKYRFALQSILDCAVPVIAAVNGAAYGGGLELALACDFIYASANAKFALPEVTLGIMPGMGGTQHLPDAVGLRRAKELLFTGKSFSADDALAWGVVNKICASENLMGETLTCVNAIISNAYLSVKAIKRTLTRSIDATMREGFSLESDHYNNLLSTKDRAEGMSAFNQKRKAVFVGE